MSFRKFSARAAAEVVEILGAEASPDQIDDAAKAIEKAMIEVALEQAERHTNAAVACCPEDRDMAHKITERIRRTDIALVANLSALR